MGGLGVFAWLAIGAAAGWTVSRLMVTAGDDALRGTSAGMIGAILSGLGTRLLESSSSPALATNGLNASLAALAGSLWLTWVTCVVTSGRERRSRPRTPLAARFDVNTPPSLRNRVQALAARVHAG